MVRRIYSAAETEARRGRKNPMGDTPPGNCLGQELPEAGARQSREGYGPFRGHIQRPRKPRTDADDEDLLQGHGEAHGIHRAHERARDEPQARLRIHQAPEEHRANREKRERQVHAHPNRGGPVPPDERRDEADAGDHGQTIGEYE